MTQADLDSLRAWATAFATGPMQLSQARMVLALIAANERLNAMLLEAAERIAKQSDALGKRAEKTT